MDLRGNRILRLTIKSSNMLSKLIVPAVFLSCLACKQKTVSLPNEMQNVYQSPATENSYAKIKNIPLPEDYERINYSPDSFAAWLRNVELKKSKVVYKFDGTPKANQSAQFAVLNISVGNKDLQQCADAVMRLRAEYLYSKKSFDKINFTDNTGRSYPFLQPYSREHFDNYLLKVFSMCGTASLAKQLKQHVEIKDIEPGDVLIRGGFPGHAEIVMDVAVNNGKKIYLLAQSYMPAQDIHVLINPANKKLSPWYQVTDNTAIETPEYTFSKYEFKRW